MQKDHGHISQGPPRDLNEPAEGKANRRPEGTGRPGVQR